jgi:hypothetical protein
MAENPIPALSNKVMQSIFKGASGSPQCLIAFTIKDGSLWLQRRTEGFPVDEFDSLVKLLQEDLSKEKKQKDKEKTDGYTNKTRRCRTRK